MPLWQIASGKRSARLRARLAAWYAPKLGPLTMISCAPPQSAWMNAATRLTIQSSYRPWRRARSSSGSDASCQVCPSIVSTQYSLMRPPSIRKAIAATMPRFSRRLSDDERVVPLDPAVRGEDDEAEADREHRAVLGVRLPVQFDDVTETVGVVARPEPEPLGADPVLVDAGRASLDRLVSLRLEDRRHGDPGLRRDRADLLRRLEDMPSVLRPQLGDHPPAPVGIGLVPERDVLLRQLCGAPRGDFDESLCLGHRLPPLIVWLLRLQRSRRKSRASITSRVTPAAPERTPVSFGRVA